MTRRQFHSLSLRIFVLALLALIPVLALMAYLGWIKAEEQVHKERTNAAHLAELLSREQTLPFSLARQLLHNLALVPAVADVNDRSACDEALRQIAARSPHLTILQVFAPDGVVWCSSAAGPQPSAADRGWFREAIESRQMTVSDYVVGRTSGRAALAMALPLTGDGGEVRSVLALGVDLAWMGRALASLPVAPGTNVVVVDGAGTVLAPERWMGRSVAQHPVFQRISGIDGPITFEAVGVDGIERIFVARPLNPDLGGRSYLWVASPRSSPVEAALHGLFGGTLLVFATVFVLFVAIWWEGSRMVLQPIRQLRAAARQIATAQGPVRTNLPHGDDEIGQLAASFDNMAAKIEEREQELEESRDSLQRLSAELERRVAERTAELEQLNRELEAFSYSVSHDLRAPLRSIEGFSRALSEECGAILGDACRDYLDRILDASVRMDRLIEDLISLGRISHQRMLMGEVDLSALVAEVGDELAAAEPSRRVELHVEPGMVVHGDRTLLRMLVRNLLENAWKYTVRAAPPRIACGMQRLPSGENAVFVQDNGIGFDMAYAERLFRPFSRLHSAEDFPGTGIGLATVARIVARHGGRVWAEAEQGQGATFRFVLWEVRS